MRIGVFDSGVGGLSILAELTRVIPRSRYFYCCDNLNFPYGTKSDEAVRSCATSVSKRFFDHARPDILVIACNTASTLALEEIRRILPIPVVGVVPAVKPAAAASRSKKIGVLATPATVQRPYLDDLVQKYAADCEVTRLGSSACVTWAEDKLRGREIPMDDLRRELAPLALAAANGMDQLVLGCTHFPLIADEIRQVLPKDVSLVDSGQAIAQRVITVITVMTGMSAGEETRDNTAGMAGELITGYCSGAEFEVAMAPRVANGFRTLRLQSLP
jgi:glutamate racemase